MSNSLNNSPKPSETFKELEEWFKKADTEKTGRLKIEQLQEALYWSQNTIFSKKACKLMLSLFDIEKNETIDLEQFKHLCVYVNRWLHVFTMYDLNNSGTIEEKDFSDALKQMGYRLSNEFVVLIMRAFVTEPTEMKLDEFIMACVQMQKYSEAFRARDYGATGTITLPYEDFLAIVLNSFV